MTDDEGATSRSRSTTLAASARARAGYVLVSLGRAGMLVGTVLAVVANLPGGLEDEYNRTGRRLDLYPSIGRVAWGLVVGFLLWMIAVGLGGAPSEPFPEQTRRWLKARTIPSAALAVGATGALVFVLLQMPSPGPDGGPDLSLPLTAMAAALVSAGSAGVAVGGVLGLLGDRRQAAERSSTLAQLAMGAGSLVFVALVSMGFAVSVVPRWAAAVNTNMTTATTPAPSNSPPELNGSVEWLMEPDETAPDNPSDAGFSSAEETFNFDLHRTVVLGTAGGAAIVEARGVRMVDVSTARERWSFQRWDTRHFGPRHTADDADVGTTAVSPNGRWLAMTAFVDARRGVLIDEWRDRTRVWVFDTVSGERLADLAVPDRSRLLAVDRDFVLLRLPATPDDPADGARDDSSAVLTMVDLEGATQWRYAPGPDCWPTQATLIGNDILTTASCDTGEEDSAPSQLVARLDGETGDDRWSWTSKDSTGPPSGAPYLNPTAQWASVTTTDDAAIVDVRVVVDHSTDDDAASHDYTVSHNLVALSLLDGHPIWEREGDMARRLVNGPSDVGDLVSSGDTFVVSQAVAIGSGPDVRNRTELQAFAAATGERLWSVEIPDWLGDGALGQPGQVVLLDDGRLVLAYGEPSDEGGGRGCVVESRRIESGELLTTLRPPDLPDGNWCEVYDDVRLIAVPGGVAVKSARVGLFTLV